MAKETQDRKADMPWSRKIAAMSVTRRGMDLALEADEVTRHQIATSLDLDRLDMISARFSLRMSSGDIVTVTGEVKAEGHQRCVVSLAPVPFSLAETVEQRYASDEVLPKPTKAEIERSLDDPDPPEPFDNGMIDIAALAVETLSLALPSFPRAEGAAHIESTADSSSVPDRESPFAALLALKARN
jgi:uncharacterized metal-binding protein YceD (DUF177 family)